MTSSLGNNWAKGLILAGATGAIYAAGNIASLSFVAIPTLDASSPLTTNLMATTLKQFRSVYNLGKGLFPVIVGASSACTFLGLYGLRARLAERSPWRRLLAAGLLALLIGPWTLGMMDVTNHRLFALDKVASAGGQIDEKEVGELLKRWQVMNHLRSLFPLAGGLLGLSAL